MRTQYITSSKDIQGGAPVITGTRIPATRVAELVKQGYDEKGVKRELGDTLSLTKVRGALYELAVLGIERYSEQDNHEPRPAHA